MRAKTIMELLTLSTNLYMISKDEEFMQNLSEMTKAGKSKVNDLLETFSEGEEGNEEKLIEKMMRKAGEAKEELEQKIEEIAVKAYQKMHIAHADDLKKALKRIDLLENKLAQHESQISNPSGK